MKIHQILHFSLLGAGNAVSTVFDWDRNVTYEGIHQSSVEIFLGIAYGQDTGGLNRFQPPRPFSLDPGTIIRAIAEGPACPQTLGPKPLYLGNVTSISEDCLHLNIARPNGTRAGDKLAVMVHIHGGSFLTGSKDVTAIQPGGLILQSVANGHPVIEVNINYRLGVFGFAKSEALTEQRSANAGLRDQRLALEWVRDNIGYFGGDCERITIFGQSSGGLAVGLQVMAYGASRPTPFHQAMCESQALEPGITGNFTDLAMQRLVNAVGCNTTGLRSQSTIACLKNLTMEQLLDAQTKTHHSDAAANLGDEWLPAVDDDFLPAAPSKLIQEGRFASVTALIGWCEDDTTLFVPTSIQTANDTHRFISNYASGMTRQSIETLLSLYPVSDFEAMPSANKSAHFFRSARIVRDILMVCQPIHYAQAISRTGRAVYLYDQNQTILTPLEDALGDPGLGVIHTSELAYVFGNLSHYNITDLPYHPSALDFGLKNRESRAWSTFASLGHPTLAGSSTLQGWTPAFLHPNEIDIFVIGGPYEGLSAEDGPMSLPQMEAQKLRERCTFINSPDIIEQLQY